MKIGKWTILLVGGFYFFLAVHTFAQGASSITVEQRKEANEVYLAQSWTKSAELYQAITEVEPRNAGALFRLGVSYHNLKKYDEAMKIYMRAESIQPNPTARYNIACVHALNGDREKSFEWLEKAIAVGFTNVQTLKTDADLANIRDSARFKAIEDKLNRAARPCEFNPQAREFDFWIGNWDVKTPQGQTAGTSKIELILGQCILLENWTNSGGSSGKSFNVYNSNDKKWHQTWVDDRGSFTHYVGGLQDGKMVVVAETFAGGKKGLARMTFTKLPTGEVRQFGENSTDDGKTWTVGFDLIYHPRKK